MRTQDAAATLADAQLRIAREYGFASWRALKAAVDASVRERAFAAARDGDLDTVRRALEAGLHPGTTDETGRTIHQIAKTLGHPQIELLMREYQERDERRDEVKHTVKVLQTAAAEGRTDDLRRLLDAHPELLDARGVDFHGQTALHKAAWNNRIECVRLLLERGADVRIRDYGDNAYALHLLVAKKNADAVRWLIDRGVDVNAKRVLWDCNHTALHVTTELEGGAIELTRMLLDAGADPNIRDDKYHATVLGWAEYCGQPQIADLLRQRGATT